MKEDSCGGGSAEDVVWAQYAKMRDALNKTGRPIWFSITQLVDYDDGRHAEYCVKPNPRNPGKGTYQVSLV